MPKELLEVAKDNSVRDYILLVHLSPCLRSLAGSLEDCETIDEDDSWIENGVPPADLKRSPEIAIRRVKTFQNDIWRCELLASAVTLSDLKRPILIALVECREAICQADVPAEMELLNGDTQEATRICQDAMRLARDRTFTELSRGSARCSAEATILCPHGCNAESVRTAFGKSLAELNLNSISTLELSSLLKTLPDPSSPSPVPRNRRKDRSLASLKWFGTLAFTVAIGKAITKAVEWLLAFLPI